MLKKWELSIPQLSPDFVRRAYIYLPEREDDDEDARYPVMYMFDGQNIFLDEEASFGTSWGMADYMDETAAPVIIVAVESHPENRLSEYSPFSHNDEELGPIVARGRTMMNWIVHDLKPYIDENYPTLPERENTFIAGSSMGGLMALYAICNYNAYFRSAACLSPSLWVDPVKAHHMLRRGRFAEDTVIYMDYGSEEMGNHAATLAALHGACASLFTRGVALTFRVVPGGTHSEASWRERIPVMMACLGF